MMIKALTVTSVSSEVAALRPSESSGREVADVVARLLADVRARGDAAVVEATARFDWEGASAAALPVPAADLEAAYRRGRPADHRGAADGSRQLHLLPPARIGGRLGG